MDEIDEKTWVLEPEKPTRSATARRIALGTDKGLRRLCVCAFVLCINQENGPKQDIGLLGETLLFA